MPDVYDSSKVVVGAINDGTVGELVQFEGMLAIHNVQNYF